MATAEAMAGTPWLVTSLVGACFLLCAVRKSTTHGSQCHSARSTLSSQAMQQTRPSISRIYHFVAYIIVSYTFCSSLLWYDRMILTHNAPSSSSLSSCHQCTIRRPWRVRMSKSTIPLDYGKVSSRSYSAHYPSAAHSRNTLIQRFEKNRSLEGLWKVWSYI